MTTIPSEKANANRTPIAVSELIRAVRLRNVIVSEVTTAAMAAPR